MKVFTYLYYIMSISLLLVIISVLTASYLVMLRLKELAYILFGTIKTRLLIKWAKTYLYYLPSPVISQGIIELLNYLLEN